ncbi:MAG: hypothetical protein C7B43_13165 [Sulfobacillus benefaciens]|jgi:hypothetical protein|uniref:Gas vesicle protein GvpFL n=1 Tax=Sulfobacillus benefaciens TaxID=453960 RepID=A0A2T2WWW6_9FIRM|nr:MAG: hypothetical protein C7B43_13165 [Sulfobacillus benefaciens]
MGLNRHYLRAGNNNRAIATGFKKPFLELWRYYEEGKMSRPLYYWYAVIPCISFNPDQFPVTVTSIPLEVLAFRDLSAVVSPTAAPRELLNSRTARKHERIMEWISEVSSYRILPFRFGSVVSGEQIERTLAERYDEWFRTLQTVSGRVEMSLKVLQSRPQEMAISTPALPSSYLTRRLRERSRQQAWHWEAESINERIQQHLEPWYIRKYENVTRPAPILINSAYLVEKDTVPMFANAIRTLIREFTAFQWLCTGPWPPYHFVTEGRAQ